MPFYCFAWCGVLTLALFCTFGAFADEEPAVTGFKVRLESAATIVRTQNPSLAAARFSIGEARGRLRQAGLLSNPEAETSFQHDPRWREFGAEVGLTQDIPVTARLRHEKEVSLAELQAAEAEVADLERRLIGQVRETLVMILALQEQRTNQAKQAKLLQQLLNSHQDHL